MNRMRKSIVTSRKQFFEELNRELSAIEDWYIFYTHPFDAKGDNENILMVSKGINDSDFYGMIIDLIKDYEEIQKRPLKHNKYIIVLSKILKDMINKGE